MTSWRGVGLLAALCAAPGIAGHEGPVAEVINNHLSARGIDHSTDRLGNVVAHLPAANAEGERAAHFDLCARGRSGLHGAQDRRQRLSVH